MRSLRHLSPILFLACFLPATLFSQPEFFGYFESEFDGARIGGQDYSCGYNKLRVDLRLSLRGDHRED